MEIDDDFGGWIPLPRRVHLLKVNGFAPEVRVYGSQARGAPNERKDLDIRFVTNSKKAALKMKAFALLHQGRGFDFGMSYKGKFLVLDCDNEAWEPYPDPGGEWCSLSDLEERMKP